MAKTFIRYLAEIPTTILDFSFPPKDFYQSHFLHLFFFISRGLHGSSYRETLALTPVPNLMLSDL